MARRQQSADQLAVTALKLRMNLLRMLKPGKVGHLGGSSSIMDVTAALYFNEMNFDGSNITDTNRDRLLFSKGHAVLAQYAALVELGCIGREELGKLKTLEGVLQGHPDMEKTPGIEAVTGSLGQGLSIGVGMAKGFKIDKKDNRVYVICGDGEAAEGQIWEAVMSASAFNLDNLTMIVDRNKLQATGSICDIFPIDSYGKKVEAFGWHVIECDGHDMNAILKAFKEAREVHGKPVAIIAHTIKGKGFPFAEGVASFHNGSLTQQQYDEALELLNRQLEEVASC
ncbi:MAG: transketolase [Sphaerochaetaceae bacterium]|nr:transketolase [Sphaerochaetaceae bacterium]